MVRFKQRSKDLRNTYLMLHFSFLFLFKRVKFWCLFLIDKINNKRNVWTKYVSTKFCSIFYSFYLEDISWLSLTQLLLQVNIVVVYNIHLLYRKFIKLFNPIHLDILLSTLSLHFHNCTMCVCVFFFASKKEMQKQKRRKKKRKKLQSKEKGVFCFFCA